MTKSLVSVIILSYNTKKILEGCLDSLALIRRRKEIKFEVIVPDNGSRDGSADMVINEFPWVKLIRNAKNLGFAAGNNTAREHVNGKYILFLNSDTVVPQYTLSKTVQFLDEHPDAAAVTCKILLPNGELDKDARRSFISPWVGLTHIFLKLDRIFPRSKIFAKYWYGYISADITHEVDVLQGAYFLVRKKVLDKVGWFDEEYFLDGEDIDLCWRIKEAGWKIYYYPEVSIVHYKGASKGKSLKHHTVSLRDRLKFRSSGVDSMEKFYRKRLWNKYPFVLNWFVILGIRVMKIIRYLSTTLNHPVIIVNNAKPVVTEK